jgi:hypothetical protein
MFSEEGGRKFHSDEAVSLIAFANGAEAGVALVIEDVAARADFDFLFALAEAACAFDVQAEFDAFRMKRAGPIKIVGGREIVAFEAEAEVLKIAEEWAPASADGLPGRRFCK